SMISTYNQQLEKNNLRIKTSLLYIDHFNEDSTYTFYPVNKLTPLYDLPICVGVGNEIALQCFVGLPNYLLLKKISFYQWCILSGWLILLILIISFSIYRYKKVYTTILKTLNSNIIYPENTEANSNKESSARFVILNEQLRFDKTSDILYTPDSTLLLKGKSRDLFLAFIQAPDYTLSFEDIHKELWANEIRTNDAIRTCISRLKKELVCINEIDIINYPGKGYRMIIKQIPYFQ
ncbi:MAG: winged helix-turn-helix domain-containing protein, partial [Tannerellaceae bacterium]|nr:winged helix-turn-helix domain-containing protein [Tannerellaceae bacterium]